MYTVNAIRTDRSSSLPLPSPSPSPLLKTGRTCCGKSRSQTRHRKGAPGPQARRPGQRGGGRVEAVAPGACSPSTVRQTLFQEHRPGSWGTDPSPPPPRPRPRGGGQFPGSSPVSRRGLRPWGGRGPQHRRKRGGGPSGLWGAGSAGRGCPGGRAPAGQGPPHPLNQSPARTVPPQ